MTARDAVPAESCFLCIFSLAAAACLLTLLAMFASQPTFGALPAAGCDESAAAVGDAALSDMPCLWEI